jgi:acyl carrier protein
VNELVDQICDAIVAVTEGRVRRFELGPETRLWSLADDESVDLDSLEILALLFRLEEASGRPLPAALELRPTATVGDVAHALASDGA